MVRRLLLLNGLATLGAVLYHVTAYVYIALFWWTDRYLPVTVPHFEQVGSALYYALRAVEQTITFAIPAFLFVSGFFVAFAAGRRGATLTGQMIGIRLKNLIIPYLLWSVVMLAGEFAQGDRQTLLEYARRLALGQATPAFYFVPLLCQLYVMAPLLVRLARSRGALLLLGSGLLQLGVYLLRYADILRPELPLVNNLDLLTAGWFFPGNIFWFAFGILAGLHLPALKARLAQVRWLLLALLPLTFIMGMAEWEVLLRASNQPWIAPRETFVDALYGVVLILTFIAFERASYPVAGPLGDLGTKSFGVYLVHSLVLTYTSKVVYHVAPGLLGLPLLYTLLLVCLGLGGPLLLMYLVNRSPARRLYSYQFG